MKCKNDSWGNRGQPIWWEPLSKKNLELTKKYKKQLLNLVNNKLPSLAKENQWSFYRHHSFLRIIYDALFISKWNQGAKVIPNYDSNKPLINQLSFPMLYNCYLIGQFMINNPKKAKILNQNSLYFRKKQGVTQINTKIYTQIKIKPVVFE